MPAYWWMNLVWSASSVECLKFEPKRCVETLAQMNDAALLVLQPGAHEIAADEAGAAGNEDRV
jgi:hypothetical protein